MSDSSQENAPTQTPEVVFLPDIAEKLPSDWSLSVNKEGSMDKQHRLQQESYELSHKRWRFNMIIVMAIVSLCFVFYLSYLTLTDPEIGINDKRWATVFVSSIVTGSIGFLTGKAVN
ncbi:MAG: hypothetical protein QNJ37_06440 [Crocosphaera sp.]|nr:hypothetical protein [Crocosphaera sp.]